ncbi:hypothetical protein BCR33DRAFT_731095 [Rhizoclosmatium globosum]|uniref:Uncharacterized protein n=1 Tax=Rhizoclosmatium globosum TaxID=329046 RepID=A0A1Y2A3D2_9FUNG|nr:hypothetical protein BCR33DRAFT_731095 [Rhizoclosmatium globosum]|eukprot:ORY17043.1 hypothetical protein BCR33DRAFT_731095 [Rhizoclosmatium globosum]
MELNHKFNKSNLTKILKKLSEDFPQHGLVPLQLEAAAVLAEVESSDLESLLSELVATQSQSSRGISTLANHAADLSSNTAKLVNSSANIANHVDNLVGTMGDLKTTVAGLSLGSTSVNVTQLSENYNKTEQLKRRLVQFEKEPLTKQNRVEWRKKFEEFVNDFLSLYPTENDCIKDAILSTTWDLTDPDIKLFKESVTRDPSRANLIKAWHNLLQTSAEQFRLIQRVANTEWIDGNALKEVERRKNENARLGPDGLSAEVLKTRFVHSIPEGVDDKIIQKLWTHEFIVGTSKLGWNSPQVTIDEVAKFLYDKGLNSSSKLKLQGNSTQSEDLDRIRSVERNVEVLIKHLVNEQRQQRRDPSRDRNERERVPSSGPSSGRPYSQSYEHQKLQKALTNLNNTELDPSAWDWKFEHIAEQYNMSVDQRQAWKASNRPVTISCHVCG